MKKAIYSIIILALVLVSIIQVAAVCTLTLDKTLYSEGETAEVTANCDSHPAESFQIATFNWTNGSISISNENIDEIFPYIKLGTKVKITN